MARRREETRRERGMILCWLDAKQAGEIRRDGGAPDLWFQSTHPFAAGDRVNFEAVPGGREARDVRLVARAPAFAYGRIAAVDCLVTGRWRQSSAGSRAPSAKSRSGRVRDQFLPGGYRSFKLTLHPRSYRRISQTRR